VPGTYEGTAFLAADAGVGDAAESVARNGAKTVRVRKKPILPL
jgi:hypothetical protein